MTLEDAIAHAKAVARENRYRTKHVLFHNNDIDEINACIECAEEHEKLEKRHEELKRYKELKENGRLIELPCDVGDILYDLNKEFVVREISFWKDDCDLYALNIKIEDWKEDFEIIALEDIGETVFLTKEEAEAKLKEAGETE